jgi:hypothetical protein
MTTTSGPGKIAPGSETSGEAAQRGLALLRLLAEAAAPNTQNWVHRRVEQLEFLDTRAVRWQVSIDFSVPDKSPGILIGGQLFRLVPLTSWEKGDLVAFDLRDECGNVMWLPNSEDTTRRLTAALSQWARIILNDLNPGRETSFPASLGSVLEQIVSYWPPEQLKKTDPLDEATKIVRRETGNRAEDVPGAEDELEKAVEGLKADNVFARQIKELWRNFLIVIAVPDLPGTRRVVKLTFESEVTFRKPKARSRRLLESLGWRAWRLDVFVGGRGGSYHLEVAAPTGVDIVQISARPAVGGKADEEFAVDGGTPHVHIRVPAHQRARYRATIRVRVSRPGWLTSSWLAGLVIAVVLIRGRLNLSVLFSTAPGAVGEAGTAATLLLAVLAVFATVLVGPGGHPLASKLLQAARFLILIDSAAVLYGVGSLLLYKRQQPPPATLWSALAWVSGTVAVLLTFSRLLPTGPRGKDREARLVPAWIKKASSNIVTLARKARAEKRGPQLDQGVVSIPAADGYHYGDDHPWHPDHQTDLISDLTRVEGS